jgi:hypothetical protein
MPLVISNSKVLLAKKKAIIFPGQDLMVDLQEIGIYIDV